MTLIPRRVEDRLAAGIKKYQPLLALAKSRDVNESDTVAILNDVLADVLGYAKYFEITSEFSIRGTYCDLAIKLEGKVVMLIEAKAIGSELMLPLEELRPNKIREFESDLEDAIRAGTMKSEADLIHFCIGAGMTCQHCTQVLQKLKREHAIECDFRTPGGPEVRLDHGNGGRAAFAIRRATNDSSAAGAGGVSR